MRSIASYISPSFVLSPYSSEGASCTQILISVLVTNLRSFGFLRPHRGKFRAKIDYQTSVDQETHTTQVGSASLNRYSPKESFESIKGPIYWYFCTEYNLHFKTPATVSEKLYKCFFFVFECLLIEYRLLSYAMIHVHVGNDLKDFGVHRDLVCHHSPYFEAALNLGFEETNTGIINFPKLKWKFSNYSIIGCILRTYIRLCGTQPN